jgi:hypothetical protein
VPPSPLFRSLILFLILRSTLANGETAVCTLVTEAYMPWRHLIPANYPARVRDES